MEENKKGSNILKDGNSENFKTGSWKARYPFHDKEKCKNCMMCVPFCPDSCIRHENGKLLGMDLDYCKGCGVCAKVCPFKAIEMKDAKDF